MTARRKLPLLDVDPDLGALVPEDRLEAARRELDVEVYRLPQGPWSAGGDDPNPEHVGLLLLEGVIAREVIVSDTVSTELLGPGDVVRPWSVREGPTLLQLSIRWNALTESRVAVLDRRFGTVLGRWPEVNAALIDRVNERAQRLATTQAISQLNRVDRRLLSLFWHLAERWGLMTSEGVAIPLTLSHRMLGQLVGARRPTISTAIADLDQRDELVRRSDGSWLLKGQPIGVPTEESERIVPIRRRLFGRLSADAGEPPKVLPVVEPAQILPAVEPAAPAPVGGPPEFPEERASGRVAVDPAVVGARRELHDTLAQLRAESRERLKVLAELTGEARRLQAEAAEARNRRAGARGVPHGDQSLSR